MNADDPLAVAVASAIREGDVEALGQLLKDNPGLAAARIRDQKTGELARTLLHVVTDWPGHVPNASSTIALPIAEGADVNGRFIGRHAETPLHWAASSGDVEALDSLLDAGAGIDTGGGVIGGGTPLSDAVAFAQWNAARRLVERGAQVTFAEAAALGLLSEVESELRLRHPAVAEINRAFWLACHGGQRATVEYLLERGAAIDWLPPWEQATPLEAARRNGFDQLADWLESQGAHVARDLLREKSEEE
ncbi:MAG: ankyrin repeat domain-containing protein [Longimicrobiales bacterium]